MSPFEKMLSCSRVDPKDGLYISISGYAKENWLCAEQSSKIEDGAILPGGAVAKKARKILKETLDDKSL